MLEKYQNYRTSDLDLAINIIGIHPLDVLVTGVTGAGKSSTLNSVFSNEIAKVGRGADPETMDLTSYRLNHYLRLWDSPGLGDGVENDEKHAKKIINLLHKKYYSSNQQYGFIDIVLVIIEGSNRDLGTNYKLINEVIVPNFPQKRILIAVNQADMAMKGNNWDYKTNQPNEVLVEFLENKMKSIQDRVKSSTGIDIIKPIYYSAEYGYNIDVLLDFLIDNFPRKKRSLAE